MPCGFAKRIDRPLPRIAYQGRSRLSGIAAGPYRPCRAPGPAGRTHRMSPECVIIGKIMPIDDRDEKPTL
jgi:hypothetical protein